MDGRLDIVEENINEFEEKTIETIHNENHREKFGEKMNKISVICEKLYIVCQSFLNSYT